MSCYESWCCVNSNDSVIIIRANYYVRFGKVIARVEFMKICSFPVYSNSMFLRPLRFAVFKYPHEITNVYIDLLIR